MFWLYFFHRFKNGLRGIEWFLPENEYLLSHQQIDLLKTWISLKPKLLLAVEKTSLSVVFKDLYTDEQYAVSMYEENLPYFIPWMSIFGLIEPFQNYYYFK